MRPVLLAVVLLALSATPAAAVTVYPGERPARNALLDELARFGQSWWHARGAQPCAAVELLLADDLTDDDGINPAARTEGCRVWVRVDIVADVQSRPRDEQSAKVLCSAVVHEV